MRPHEERISVGGIDVHTWVGGSGDPAAGAPRRRRQSRLAVWMDQVAQRYTMWAPTHPGFGASGDARSGWKRVDDLARFYLWFIDAARLAGPTCSASRSAAGRRRSWPR